MRIQQITETEVKSSWIKDITNTGNHATMTLGNGKAYQILNIGPEGFDKWFNSPSKGNFYNTKIRDNFEIRRIA